jgi:hypothetical protein
MYNMQALSLQPGEMGQRDPQVERSQEAHADGEVVFD